MSQSDPSGHTKTNQKESVITTFFLLFSGAYQGAIPEHLKGQYAKLGAFVLVSSIMKGGSVAQAAYAISKSSVAPFMGGIGGTIVFLCMDLAFISYHKRNPMKPPLYVKDELGSILAKQDALLRIEKKDSENTFKSFLSKEKLPELTLAIIRISYAIIISIWSGKISSTIFFKDSIIEEYQQQINRDINTRIDPEIKRAEKEAFHADGTSNKHAQTKLEYLVKERRRLVSKMGKQPDIMRQLSILSDLEKKNQSARETELLFILVYGGLEIAVFILKITMPYDAYDDEMNELDTTTVINSSVNHEIVREEAKVRKEQHSKTLTSMKNNVNGQFNNSPPSQINSQQKKQ